MTANAKFKNFITRRDPCSVNCLFHNITQRSPQAHKSPNPKWQRNGKVYIKGFGGYLLLGGGMEHTR